MTSIDNRALLRSLMKQGDLTQRATAELLGVNIRTVRRWIAPPETDPAEAPHMALMALELAVKSLGRKRKSPA